MQTASFSSLRQLLAVGLVLVVAEAMHFRYHPLVERVRQLIVEGTIGELERIDASF